MTWDGGSNQAIPTEGQVTISLGKRTPPTKFAKVNFSVETKAYDPSDKYDFKPAEGLIISDDKLTDSGNGSFELTGQVKNCGPTVRFAEVVAVFYDNKG